MRGGGGKARGEEQMQAPLFHPDPGTHPSSCQPAHSQFTPQRAFDQRVVERGGGGGGGGRGGGAV